MKRAASWICLAGLSVLGCGDGGDGGDSSDGGATATGFAATCAQFAQTYTTCVEAECAQVTAVREQMIAYYTAACRSIEGNTTQEKVYRMIAGLTCEDAYYTASVDELINDGGADGDKGLKRFCAEGPLTPPATCTSRCATVTGCLTPQNPYSLLIADSASCEYGCLTDASLGQRIACLEQTGCVDASCDDG